MSKQFNFVKQEDPLLKKCLKHVQALPNLEVTPSHLDTNDVDGLLTIRSSINSVNYAYTIQPDVTVNSIKLVIRYFKLLKEKVHPEKSTGVTL